MIAIVAQPYRGHLNGNVHDERATVAGTRAQSLTVIISPIDIKGMIGTMQVLVSRTHAIHEVYHLANASTRQTVQIADKVAELSGAHSRQSSGGFRCRCLMRSRTVRFWRVPDG